MKTQSQKKKRLHKLKRKSKATTVEMTRHNVKEVVEID